MRIATRFMLILLATALIPVLLVAWISVERAKTSIIRVVGEHFSEIADTKADALALLLQERIRETRRLASHDSVIEALRAANAAYGPRPMERIEAIDRAWVEQQGRTAVAERLLAAPLSLQLKHYQKQEVAQIGEIFLTDRHGATQATTKRLSDYYQADEDWWSIPVKQGRNGLFIDDRGMDESLNALAVGISLPVMDGETVIGVLKINYRIDKILDILTAKDHHARYLVTLHRAAGEVVVDPTADQGALAPPLTDVPIRVEGRGWVTGTRGDRAVIVGYSRVAIPIHSRISLPGAVKGVSGERWEPASWFVYVEQPREKALAEVVLFQRLTLIVALFTIFIAAVIALAVARSISKPIQRLKEGTERIAAGDLDHRVGTWAADEIGDLSRAFDAMSQRLQHVMASRTALQQEVAARRELERRLALSNRELQEFAYVISHDLQEPLRMIASYLKLIEKRYQGALDADADEFIDFAVDGAERMSTMIDGLLQYSRVETQGAPFQSMELSSAVSDALANLKVQIDESGAVIETGALPRVMADPMQMTRLLQNLLSNAIKFHGPEPIKISINAERQGSEWVISVKDNGIGISEEDSSRVFVVFQRLHTQQEYPGTGIGLAVCKRIVERHGGRIWLKSAAEEGSEFLFTLPIGEK
ncbi:MAG: HAMP domain-containing protein [Candidatus Thiodiazotropha sp. (ex Dulcina madagascariensis)]|nr:HAMP domain-containing protein [Candidatus Thiodiazotropha sp. (ex Dulcina madagascariensis)]